MSNKDMYYNAIRANVPENEVIEKAAQGRRSRSEDCMDLPNEQAELTEPNITSKPIDRANHLRLVQPDTSSRSRDIVQYVPIPPRLCTPCISTNSPPNHMNLGLFGHI
jgi:hypothetical protein